ncbi:MAG: response regulator, partial [Gemmatimonadota bacterium]
MNGPAEWIARVAPGRILVVDDHEPNRQLLADILEMQDHVVITATSGAEALASVAERQPDLILLDVNMPDIDGLEVCRRLRADLETASLPIILVTSLTHREHRLDGIAAGANDYLTKPIDRPDLLLRVRNALHMGQLHRRLATQYEDLQRLETLRDTLVHMLVHDLRSPLHGVMLYLEVIRQRLREVGLADVLEDVEEVSTSVGTLAD